MKSIGFIDYYISEWHANNYPKWIKKASEELGYDFEVKYVWAEKDFSDVDGKTTEEWCKEYGVEKCDTIEELCEKSDYILVLAPSNPETHLRYAEKVLRYGKNTYIDKTFAPDYETAEKIFSLGKEYGTKFFSTSALRYATELKDYAGKCDAATVFGSGSSIEEYVIHQVETLVKLMGTGAKKVRLDRAEDQYNLRFEYDDGRKANMIFCETYGLPAGFIPHTKGSESSYVAVNSDFFAGLIADILKFYKEGKLPFDPSETLEVMKIREAIIKAKAKDGEWILIK
ncbi:MAG: Gfo/Idh/MocA family oxidoreductase [Eubacteriales bacterium]